MKSETLFPCILRISIIFSIVTDSGMLKETKTWNEQIVEELVTSSSHLAEMLNNTLDISKLEEGKVEFNTDFYTVNSVIDTVLCIAKSSASKKAIKLNTKYSQLIPQLIEIDKSRFTQVVMNLVGNAIKFTPQNGQIDIYSKWYNNCGAISGGDCEKCDGKETMNIFEKTDSSIMQNIAEESNLPLNSINEEEKEVAENIPLNKLKKNATERDIWHSYTDRDIMEGSQTNINVDDEENYCYETEEYARMTEENIDDKLKLYDMTPKAFNTPRLELKGSRHRLGSMSVQRRDSRNKYEAIDLRKGVLQKSVAKNKKDSFSRESYKQLFYPDKTESKAEQNLIKKNSSKVLMIKKIKKNFFMSLKMPKLKVKKFISPKQVDIASLPNATSYLYQTKLFNENGQSKNLQQPLEKLEVSEPSEGKFHKSSSSKGLCYSNFNFNTKNHENKPKYFCKYLIAQPTDGTLEIRIKDSGCGISKEDQEKLFKPFAQANKGVHSKFGGTGLGLWLSHKLILAMKGTIQCESEVGKGTTFIIRVPMKCKTGKNALSVSSLSIITVYRKSLKVHQLASKNYQ